MDPIAKWARRIRDVERLAFRAATQPQLAYSSIEDGAIQSVEDGTLKAIIGKQFDGTQAITVVNGPVPPTPSTPGAVAALEGAILSWDGTFADGSVAPMDFTRVEVHASTDPDFTAEFADTLKATFETPRGAQVFVALPVVEHYVRLVARSATGGRSAASVVTPVTPQSLADALPAPSDGNAPTSSPAPVVSGGIGSLFLSWVPVVNADPVVYEVHASATAGFTPDSSTLVTETPATQYVLRHLPGSTTPISYSAPTHIRIVAKDMDGAAAPSAEVSDVAVQVESVDIADGAITTIKIPDDAISAAKIAAGAVGTTEIALDAITSDLIAAGAIGSGELATDAVTAAKIAAGAVGTSEIALDAVTNDLIAAGAVTATEISDGAISTPKLAAGAVTAAKIAADTITANEIAAGAVTASEIATGAVTAEKLTVGSLGASMVRNGQFEEVSAADPTRPAGWLYNTIWAGATPALQTTSPISGTRSVNLPCTPTTSSHVISERFPVIPGQVLAVKYRTKADVAQPAGLYAVINGGASPTDTSMNVDSTGVSSWNQPVVTALTEHTAIFTIPAGMSWAAFTVLNYGPSGTTCTVTVDDISVQQVIVSAQISDGAISTPKLAAGAVTAAKIAADTITANELAAGAVTASEIAAGAVTTAKLAADAVTANEIAAGAVTATELAANAVTAAKILAGEVTAEKIATGAISAEKLAAGSVVTDKLAANAVSADKLAATIVLGTQIMTGPSDQNRVLLDSTGIQVLKADNSQRAVLPTDPNSPVFIKGTAELDQVVINDKMTVRGTNNAVAPGANIQLQGSVKDPQSQISATTDWETVQAWADPTAYSAAIRGLTTDGSSTYYYANIFFGTQILAYAENGGFSGNVSLPDVPTGMTGYDGYYSAWGGVVKVGIYYYTLGTIHRISDNKNVWQIRKWTIDFVAGTYVFQQATDVGVDTVDMNGSGTYPIIGKGATTGIAIGWWAGVSAGNYVLYAEDVNATTLARNTASGVNYGPNVGSSNIGDLLYFEQGSFDYGAARTIFAHKQGANPVIRAFNGATSAPADEFKLPGGAIGVCYNANSTNSFRTAQVSGSHLFNVKHTLINWSSTTTTSDTWWGTFTYRNGANAYETGQSLYKGFTMEKRQRLTITTPAIPPGGTGTDPDRVRMWVGQGATQPARTAMWTFAAPAAGVITATQNTQVFGSPNTNPPAANNFPTSASSKISSSDGTKYLNSDGDAVVRNVTADKIVSHLRSVGSYTATSAIGPIAAETPFNVGTVSVALRNGRRYRVSWTGTCVPGTSGQFTQVDIKYGVGATTGGTLVGPRAYKDNRLAQRVDTISMVVEFTYTGTDNTTNNIVAVMTGRQGTAQLWSEVSPMAQMFVEEIA